MVILTFPPTPSLNEIFTATNTVEYIWLGDRWDVNSSPGGGGGGNGISGYSGYSGVALLTGILANFPGSLITLIGTLRYYPKNNITLTNVFVSMGLAPGPSGAVFNVRKNNVALFSNPNKPTVAFGNYTSIPQSLNVSLTTTDYITIDVEVPSGGDAVVRIDYQ